MLHDQEDRLAAPAAPNGSFYFRIYIQALGVLWCVERAKRQKRDEIRQDHHDHRRQKLTAVAPQNEQRDLKQIYLVLLLNRFRS